MSATRGDAGSRLLRLLAVLTWLARRGRAPTAELSERFGLSPDELIADLELAACCGLPPYSPDQLMEIVVDEQEVIAHLGSELARPRRLTAAEGFGLAAAGRAISAVPGADPDGTLRSALDKLEAVLGERGVLRIDLDEPAHLAVIQDAARRGRQLELRYWSASSDEETQRVVDPMAVVSIEGRWYLDGYCHRARGMRRFRVDRVSSVRETGSSTSDAAPPGQATPEGPIGITARGDDGSGEPGAFVPGPETVVAKLLIDPDGAWIVEAVPTLGSVTRSDGRIEVALPVASRVWLARLLLRLGPHVQVLEPREFAEVARDAARRLLARYRPNRRGGRAQAARDS